ncbi:GAF domain-containing protein [Nocardia sp. NPDC051756]|uniref:GAF domain-containing protein n=1 Tax=Nocardia sp. NPDC051756 TaxID=3154751 RepID=UPI00341C4507
MSFTVADLTGDRTEQYQQLVAQAEALVAGEHDRVANAANLSSLVFHALPELNWVGFYFYDGNELVVGPFQGQPACVRIAIGKGVCGTAAQTRETQLVPDVHAFPGHIACDAETRSEVVIPLVHNGELVGVFDLDSPKPDRFDEIDQAGLESVARAFLSALPS